jgi:hypothetical protein
MIDDNPYGWRAGVRDNPVMMSLEVTVGEAYPDFVSYVTQIDETGVQREQVERGVYAARSLNMPRDMARALYDALADHFNGTSGTRQLRADFNHERGRVDRLIDTVSKIATGEPR